MCHIIQRLHHCTSLCLARLERLEDAERSVGQALAIYNNAVSLCHLARVRTAAGDIIGAIKAYEQAHRLVILKKMDIACFRNFVRLV